MGPAAGAAGLGALFCICSMAAWGESESNVKNVSWMRYHVKTEASETDMYLGLTHTVTASQVLGVALAEIKENRDVLCTYDDDGKKTDDDCIDNCKEAKSEHWEFNDDWEKDCDQNQRNLRANKHGFAGAFLGFFFLFLTAVISVLRIQPAGFGQTQPAKIGGIVLSFLAWLFTLVAWSYWVAEPFGYMVEEMDLETSCKAAGLEEGSDCYLRIGPGLALLISAWVFTFVPLICHIICPLAGGEKGASSPV